METLNVPFKPWEHMTYATIKTVSHKGYGGIIRTHSYDAIFETLKSYDRSHWKPGDVIKFGDGISQRASAETWRNWFLNDADLDAYLKENRLYSYRIPAYARNQYAIMLARYKWTKFKGFGKYIDYGSFIMMLTGSKVGYIRKYYITTPWTDIGQYPYTKMRYKLNRDKLFHGVERGDDSIVFIENLVRELTNGN